MICDNLEARCADHEGIFNLPDFIIDMLRDSFDELGTEALHG